MHAVSSRSVVFVFVFSSASGLIFLFPANGRQNLQFFGTERTLSADTVIRSVLPRTARRVPGRVAHTRRVVKDIGFDYEIKNYENGARISRSKPNRLCNVIISREQNGFLLPELTWPGLVLMEFYF